MGRQYGSRKANLANQIRGYLATVLDYVNQGALRSALATMERGVTAIPDEPIMHLRYLDILSQFTQKQTTGFQQYCINLEDTDQRCAVAQNDFRHKSVLPLQALKRLSGRSRSYGFGDSERAIFTRLIRAYEVQGWVDLHADTLQAARAYFPLNAEFVACSRRQSAHRPEIRSQTDANSTLQQG